MTCAYSSHQVSSRTLQTKCFPRCPVSKISVSPLQPSLSLELIRIEHRVCETQDSSIYQVLLRSDHQFVRYLDFHVFQEFQFPPPTLFKATGPGRN